MLVILLKFLEKLTALIASKLKYFTLFSNEKVLKISKASHYDYDCLLS